MPLCMAMSGTRTQQTQTSFDLPVKNNIDSNTDDPQNSHVKESLDTNHRRRDYSVLCHNLHQLHQSTVASLWHYSLQVDITFVESKHT